MPWNGDGSTVAWSMTIRAWAAARPGTAAVAATATAGAIPLPTARRYPSWPQLSANPEPMRDRDEVEQIQLLGDVAVGPVVDDQRVAALADVIGHDADVIGPRLARE